LPAKWCRYDHVYQRNLNPKTPNQDEEVCGGAVRKLRVTLDYVSHEAELITLNEVTLHREMKR